jgi:hypothetical protein
MACPVIYRKERKANDFPQKWEVLSEVLKNGMGSH